MKFHSLCLSSQCFYCLGLNTPSNFKLDNEQLNYTAIMMNPNCQDGCVLTSPLLSLLTNNVPHLKTPNLRVEYTSQDRRLYSQLGSKIRSSGCFRLESTHYANEMIRKNGRVGKTNQTTPYPVGGTLSNEPWNETNVFSSQAVGRDEELFLMGRGCWKRIEVESCIVANSSGLRDLQSELIRAEGGDWHF